MTTRSWHPPKRPVFVKGSDSPQTLTPAVQQQPTPKKTKIEFSIWLWLGITIGSSVTGVLMFNAAIDYLTSSTDMEPIPISLTQTDSTQTVAQFANYLNEAAKTNTAKEILIGTQDSQEDRSLASVQPERIWESWQSQHGEDENAKLLTDIIPSNDTFSDSLKKAIISANHANSGDMSDRDMFYSNIASLKENPDMAKAALTALRGNLTNETSHFNQNINQIENMLFPPMQESTTINEEVNSEIN